MKTAVSNVAPGKVVKFHGKPCIVLEHRTAGTLLMTAAGNVSRNGCTSTFGSRPAFLIPSQYAVEVDGGLDQYTTNELIAEINRRMNG